MPNLVKCPYCGKEVYEMVTTCPNCGGPIRSKAVEEAENKEFETRWREACKNEKVWLIFAFAVAAFEAYIVNYGGEKPLGWMETAIMCYFTAAIIYGAHMIHWFRSAYEKYGLLIALIAGYFGLLAGGFVGIVYLPKALLKFIFFRPMISKKEFAKQLKEQNTR